MESADKVLVVGLDGATFDLIKPWVAEGKLPTLANLMQGGAYGNLRSVPNMHSAAAWPSFATGKNPGKHGLFWQSVPNPGSYDIQFLDGSSCQAVPIWRILSQASKKVGVINVPMTFPAEQLNGFLLAGFDCPGTDVAGFAYPPDLSKEIAENCGEYIIMSRATVYAQEGKFDQSIQMLHEQIEKRLAVTRYLMRTHPWDLFVVVFSATDMAQHVFWHLHDISHPAHDPILVQKYADPISDVYKKLDSSLGQLLQKTGDETTVIVMSDHGAGPNNQGTRFLNQWLEAEGFLRYVSPSVLGRLGLGARHATLFGANAFIWLMQHVLGERVVRVFRKWTPFLRGRIASGIRTSQIDWHSTRAYWDGGSNAIRINLVGRELQGIVKPGREYEELREEIVKRLSRCRDVVTGRLAVEKVHKREEIYHGPYVDRAPDLEIVWKTDGVIHGLVSSEYKSRRPRLLGNIETSLWATTGDHSMNGILIMKGKNVNRSMEIKRAEIIDLAPTILYLMGQAIPADMDGRVLEEAIDPSFLRAHPIQHTEPLPQGPSEEGGEPYSEEEKKEIEERLRGLGYIQ